MTTTEGTTPSASQINAWAAKMFSLVIEDMLDGRVATEVGAFSDLDYHVDASTYATRAGVPAGTDPGAISTAEGLVDAMLPLSDIVFDLRDLVIEGWAARMVRELQILGRAGKLASPHATTLTGLGIPVPADLLAEGMGEDEGVEAVFLNVRASLPAITGVLVDDALTNEVLGLVIARLPLFVTLDNAQATALHEVVETALATPGFIDERCEDERPGLEKLGQHVGVIAADKDRAPEFAALHHGQVTDLYQILEIAVQEPIAWPPAGTERPSLDDLFTLLERIQRGGTA